ncbi:hypothetical protein D9M71_346030 [compost metagenome]
MGDGGFIHRQQAVADKVAAVMAGIGRADDPTVKHVGQAHVVHIGQLAGGLARDVYPCGATPDQAVVLDGLERGVVGNVQPEVLTLHQFGKAQRAAVTGDNRAVFNAQHFGRAAKA